MAMKAYGRNRRLWLAIFLEPGLPDEPALYMACERAQHVQTYMYTYPRGSAEVASEIHIQLCTLLVYIFKIQHTSDYQFFFSPQPQNPRSI